MRRRESPFSRVEAVRRSRSELVVLVVSTVVLGLIVNVLASALYQALGAGPRMSNCQVVAIVLGFLGLLLFIALLVAVLAHRATSRRVAIEVWLPYCLRPPEVGMRRSYRPSLNARRAFARAKRCGSLPSGDLEGAWAAAASRGEPLTRIVAGLHGELVQYLVLSAIHDYADHSVGPEAPFTWWASGLIPRRMRADELPEVLRNNRFFCADAQPAQWRLWWPRDVCLRLLPEADPAFPRWRIEHRHYGCVELRAHPRLSGAARSSQVGQIFLQRLAKDREWGFVGLRLEARAEIRWAFLPATDSFHAWATGLLSWLEETLDWGYYLSERPARLIAELDRRVGNMDPGESLWAEMQSMRRDLSAIRSRLEERSEQPTGDLVR